MFELIVVEHMNDHGGMSLWKTRFSLSDPNDGAQRHGYLQRGCSTSLARRGQMRGGLLDQEVDHSSHQTSILRHTQILPHSIQVGFAAECGQG